MDRELFPFPNSGQIAVVPMGSDTFQIEVSGMDTIDYQQLMGFFCRMRGRFGEFRFEHGGVVHPKCRFDSDVGNFSSDGPDKHSASLPIKILL